MSCRALVLLLAAGACAGGGQRNFVAEDERADSIGDTRLDRVDGVGNQPTGQSEDSPAGQGAADGASSPTAPAAPTAVGHATAAGGDGADIDVSVRWLDAPAHARQAPGRNRCGKPLRPPAVVHALGGVRDVVVVLMADGASLPKDDIGEGIGEGRTGAQVAGPLLRAVRDCRLEPRVGVIAQLHGQRQPDTPSDIVSKPEVSEAEVSGARVVPRVVPRVVIESEDEMRHVLQVEYLGPLARPLAADTGAESPMSARTHAFPLPVSGSATEVSLWAPGLFRIRGGSTVHGGPARVRASRPRTADTVYLEDGYVVVANTPHVAVTDDRGRVSLRGVSAGRYEVFAWHPPLAPDVDSRDDATGKRRAGAKHDDRSAGRETGGAGGVPVGLISRSRVTVTAGERLAVDLALSLP